MSNAKKAYPAICTRCDGKGNHQGGKCFQCKGSRLIKQKTSKVMKTFAHPVTIDGKKMQLVTWGRDLKEAVRCAEIWFDKNGYNTTVKAA